MIKSKSKLMAAILLTLVSITLIVTVSYAWISLAGKPSLEGVEINIGGSNTIKIAADMTKVVDGTTVHYPGAFLDTFDAMNQPDYSYLYEVAGLTPVSTADGLNWFMPGADQDMGEFFQLTDYQVDNMLSHANIPQMQAEDLKVNESGHYVYLDFWVVSPMSDCNVRVSIGSQLEGSYVTVLPQVITDATSMTGYALESGNNQLANCVRVGFLVNTDAAEDSFAVYKESGGYSKEYKEIRGIYQEPGNIYNSDLDYRFTIYEPNGDAHNETGLSLVQTENGLTYVDCQDGDYVITRPIGYQDGKVSLVNINEILTVQRETLWRQTGSGELLIGQIFQSSMLNQDLSSMSKEEIMKDFYFETWKGGFQDQILRGEFWQDTRDLYLAGTGNVTTSQQMESLKEDNVTDHAIIVNLDKNVPQRVRMYVWIEGQDVDCVREAALETLIIGIELAGSTLK